MVVVALFHCRKGNLRGDGYRGCRVLSSVVSWRKVGSLIGQHGDASRVRIGSCRRCVGCPSWFETTEIRSILFAEPIEAVKTTSRSASCSAGQSSNSLKFTQLMKDSIVQLDYSIEEGVPGQALSTDRSSWCIVGCYAIN